MIDTNIIAYAASRAAEDARKAAHARDLIKKLDFAISGQILQEFYVTVTRKMRVRLSHEEALDWLDLLNELPCVGIDPSLVRRGAVIAETNRISYWDGAVIAAAERSGASILYTEDLNHNQLYGAVRVLNPFLEN
ncbi:MULTISPECIES: PIN domain-containing protein [unclassified Devosia]|uniref:PIN domain-containing protein n=1 Tax=unclassified Devosia TaxID=196773 RepID=UPI001AC598E9|nr:MULTISPECIES: PIN domain-containing protein [unclassified Devosia]MBN9307162.1 PIN domain-containing protein [Devosia sp.]